MLQPGRGFVFRCEPFYDRRILIDQAIRLSSSSNLGFDLRSLEPADRTKYAAGQLEISGVSRLPREYPDQRPFESTDIAGAQRPN